MLLLSKKTNLKPSKENRKSTIDEAHKRKKTSKKEIREIAEEIIEKYGDLFKKLAE